MTASDAVRSSDTRTWDDFWAEVNTDDGPVEVIRGVEVRVPQDMPLNFRRRLQQLEASDSEEDIHELVGSLFGAGVFQQWLDAGMGGREFKVVLAWGMANASGQALDFREAYDRVVAMEQGKAPSAPANRAARRSQSKGTGGRSKRTSSASTASAPGTSRT